MLFSFTLSTTTATTAAAAAAAAAPPLATSCCRLLASSSSSSSTSSSSSICTSAAVAVRRTIAAAASPRLQNFKINHNHHSTPAVLPLLASPLCAHHRGAPSSSFPATTPPSLSTTASDHCLTLSKQSQEDALVMSMSLIISQTKQHRIHQQSSASRRVAHRFPSPLFRSIGDTRNDSCTNSDSCSNNNNSSNNNNNNNDNNNKSSSSSLSRFCQFNHTLSSSSGLSSLSPFRRFQHHHHRHHVSSSASLRLSSSMTILVPALSSPSRLCSSSSSSSSFSNKIDDNNNNSNSPIDVTSFTDSAKKILQDQKIAPLIFDEKQIVKSVLPSDFFDEKNLVENEEVFTKKSYKRNRTAIAKMIVTPAAKILSSSAASDLKLTEEAMIHFLAAIQLHPNMTALMDDSQIAAKLDGLGIMTVYDWLTMKERHTIFDADRAKRVDELCANVVASAHRVHLQETMNTLQSLIHDSKMAGITPGHSSRHTTPFGFGILARNDVFPRALNDEWIILTKKIRQ